MGLRTGNPIEPKIGVWQPMRKASLFAAASSSSHKTYGNPLSESPFMAGGSVAWVMPVGEAYVGSTMSLVQICIVLVKYPMAI